jgi:hypothetical protein
MTTTRQETQNARREPERTCAACRRRAPASELLRWVLDADRTPSVDLERRRPGRGAWLHATPSCLALGPRALRRAFKSDVSISGAAFDERLRRASNARFATLLRRARRAGAVRAGEVAAERAMTGGEGKLLVVATDAWELSGRPWVREAVARGAAVAWGRSTEVPGEFPGLGEQVLAVLDERLSLALSRVPALGGLPAGAPAESLNSEVG